MTAVVHSPIQPDFQRLTVASFESRMAVEMARLIERYGGRPLVVPAIREILLDDNSAALEFGMRLTTERVDMVIFLTGVGTTTLFDLLQIRYPVSDLAAAMKKTIVVARGPKPLAALRKLNLNANITVPEPNTWVDLVSTLDKDRPVKGLRVAVQEYGAANPELLEALQQRGAEVFQVPVYKWALPDNLEPLRQVLDRIIAGEVAVILITNAAQVDHVTLLAEQDGRAERLRSALKKLVVASIGPTASERLHQQGWPVDIEPSHPKMGVLVKEVSERVRIILEKKVDEH